MEQWFPDTGHQITRDSDVRRKKENKKVILSWLTVQLQGHGTGGELRHGPMVSLKLNEAKVAGVHRDEQGRTLERRKQPREKPTSKRIMRPIPGAHRSGTVPFSTSQSGGNLLICGVPGKTF